MSDAAISHTNVLSTRKETLENYCEFGQIFHLQQLPLSMDKIVLAAGDVAQSQSGPHRHFIVTDLYSEFARLRSELARKNSNRIPLGELERTINNYCKIIMRVKVY